MTSRSALIEEGVVKSVHAKLIADRAPPQTGLIVGKREVGARDFILALVPSPDWNAEDGDGDSDRAPPGGGTPQAQRPAGAGAPLHVDADSILEHVTQVTRMLPGGLDVVGAYAFASEQAWRSASGALARAATEAAEAVKENDTEANVVEQFLLYLSADDMQKTSLRRVKRSDASQPFALLPPAESREGKATASLVRLETEYAAQVSVVAPTTRESTRNGRVDAKERTLRSFLKTALRHETARVMASDVLVENALWDDDVAISAVPRARRGSDDLSFSPPEKRRGEREGTPRARPPDDVFALRAELLPPPKSAACLDALGPAPDSSELTAEDGLASRRSARVKVTFEGVVSARAYAFARSAVGDAASDLRRDVARSLRSRLDAFLDEADDALEDPTLETRGRGGSALASLERSARDASSLADADGEGGSSETDASASWTFAFPRRAWAEWRGGLAVCDYLADGETEADVVARCVEVMRFDVVGGARGVVLAEAEHRRARGESGGGSVAARRETRAAGNAEKNASTSTPPSTASGKKPSSSYAAYALGAGVALVSAGLANLVTKSPDIAACVGELCARAAEAAERAPY